MGPRYSLLGIVYGSIVVALEVSQERPTFSDEQSFNGGVKSCIGRVKWIRDCQYGVKLKWDPLQCVGFHLAGTVSLYVKASNCNF